MRRKRRNKRKIVLKLTLLGLVPIILFLLYFVQSNILTIRSIEVSAENINCATPDQIRWSSKLFETNILLVNSAKLEDELKKQFYCIKSIKFATLPSKIKLHVFGREPAAILIPLKYDEASKSSELTEFSKKESTSSAEASSSAGFRFFTNGSTEFFQVDNEGIIYSANVEQLNVPKVYINQTDLILGQKVTDELIINTLKILQNLKILGVNIRDAKIYPNDLLLINTLPRIIFKLDNSIDTQTASLQLILNTAKINSESLEFIDLRFDKPVVRYGKR